MRKKSSYRPRGILIDTMAFVKESLEPIKDRSEGVTFKLHNHQAMTSLAQGRGTFVDVDVVMNALNATEALARLNVGKDWFEEIEAAQDALQAMANRGFATGKFIFKAQELTAINLAMEVHDVQLDSVTVGQMTEAIMLARSLQKSGAAKVLG